MPRDPRRVLLLTSGPLEGSEGADKRLSQLLVEAIPEAEFTWFTRWPPRGAPRLAAGRRVPIASRDGIPRVPERLQAGAAGVVLARRADLIHAVLTIGGLFPLLSRVWPLLMPARPVIHTVPGVMDPTLLARSGPLGRAGPGRPGSRRQAGPPTVTVALSEATARELRDAGFGEVRVIPPAVDPQSWPRRPRPAGPPTVLFAGHHDRGGGAAEAIAAAARAHRDGARFRLVLAMRMRPGEDERMLAAGLARLAGRAGLRDVVVHGHVSDMAGLLAAADVLLFTPWNLAGKADIPLVALEALATGRPVILSDLPQFAAFGDAALRAPAGDADRAGRLLAELLTDPRRWQERAGRGPEKVRTCFSPERFADAYRRLYEAMLG